MCICGATSISKPLVAWEPQCKQGHWCPMHASALNMLLYLSGGMRLLVAGKDLKHHTAAGLLQHLLQHTRVVTHLSPVHLFDDVTHMEQTLLVDHPPVEDAGDYQLSVLNTECHTLTKQQKSETRSQNTPSTFRIWWNRFHDFSMTFIYQFTILECSWSAHRKQWMQSYQMLSSHFADAHHADGISWCTIDGRLHESTRARGRSLTRLRGHRVMRFQQRLIIKSTACQSLIRLFIIWFDRLAGLQRCTWKCGWLSMCDSSAAVLLRCVKGLSSLRMSCTSSTLLSLTASSRVSSRLSAL